MGIAERKEREKVALRQAILTSARELFAQEGYENVSMRRVAEKIEHSPTSIYLYFRDKDELIYELCSETFALLSTQIEAAVAGKGTPLERLKRGLRAYVDFGIEHPHHYQTTFLTRHAKTPTAEQIENSPGTRTFQCLVRGVTECVEAGLFRSKNVMAISQSLWTVIHGLTSLQITHGNCFPWIDREELINMTLDNALQGLRKSPK
jgi:AcrR family transcriptional regulator